MDKNQAKKSIKKITGDSASLNPTSLVTLFEIDVSEIAINESLLKNLKFGNTIDKVFRFHNNVKVIIHLNIAIIIKGCFWKIR